MDLAEVEACLEEHALVGAAACRLWPLTNQAGVEHQHVPVDGGALAMFGIGGCECWIDQVRHASCCGQRPACSCQGGTAMKRGGIYTGSKMMCVRGGEDNHLCPTKFHDVGEMELSSACKHRTCKHATGKCGIRRWRRMLPNAESAPPAAA